jgi:Protein of unknown function (DUF2384)
MLWLENEPMEQPMSSAVRRSKIETFDINYASGETAAPPGFQEAQAMFDHDSLASQFGVSKRDIAETAGLSVSATYRKSRAASPSAEARLAEMGEILRRVTAWAGGGRQALAWYRAEPIPAFGGRTAESIVKSGKASALRDYLDHLALGGFA